MYTLLVTTPPDKHLTDEQQRI